MPRRSTGGMGKRDEIEPVRSKLDLKYLTDHLVQSTVCQELFDREFPNRYDQLRLEQGDFLVEPGGAVRDFVAGRDAIAPCFLFAGKATADSRHVNALPELFFGEVSRLLKPFEKCFSRCPGEWSAEDWLFISGCLAHQKHFAPNRAAAHHWLVHAWAEGARTKPLDVEC